MLGYTYTYISFNELLAASGTLLQFSFIQIIITALLLWMTIFCIFIFVPLVYITVSTAKEIKEKKKKKQLLTQFLLQKEIEDEVEKEIKIQEEGEVMQ